MLSYQHGYHAGGPADLHKHVALAELLDRLTAKPRGISYVETHAGRGLYDIAAPEALKTGEAAQGIGRLAPEPSSPFGRALAAGKRVPPEVLADYPEIAAAVVKSFDESKHPRDDHGRFVSGEDLSAAKSDPAKSSWWKIASA